MNKDRERQLLNSANVIILLVDQKISYISLNECNNISNTIMYIINFGSNFPIIISSAAHTLRTYKITDVESAVKLVQNYYK